MNRELVKRISLLCKELFSNSDVKVELTRPEETFGDYSTNVAMQLSGRLGKPPREIAEQIVKNLAEDNDIEEVNVAGPGFINIKLKDKKLFELALAGTEIEQVLNGKVIVAEYSDPNPFKALHAGHLYTTLVGDALSNTLEAAGATVHRVNFGGDVGLHVAKAIWGINQEVGSHPEKLKEIAILDRAEWINSCYVYGNETYEKDETVKNEIIKINKKIYKIHEEGDESSSLAKIYWTCRQWSYDGFNDLYEKLLVKPFEKYYPESSVDQIGLKTINKHTGTGKVYEKSDGAVVFNGEKHGLFTQVFINSQGLTTYAGKDVGLIIKKQEDFNPDISYIITDASQKDHLRVVMKSIEQFAPELANKTIHRTHGRIKLPGGKKMSSRSGRVVMANDVLTAARANAKDDKDEVIIGAIRYSFLKTKVGGDIIYDAKESVSHEGNSGPYLQYALVRARSILKKLENKETGITETKLDSYERSLALKISMFEEVFRLSLQEYSPHHVCNYLYELSQIFNRFYENKRVQGHERENLRTNLVIAYEKVLSRGLELLGMPRPEEM